MIHLFASLHRPLRPLSRRTRSAAPPVPRALPSSGPIVLSDVRGLGGPQRSALTDGRRARQAGGRGRLRGIRLVLASLTLLAGAIAIAAPPATAQNAVDTPTGIVDALYAAHALAFAKRGPDVMQTATAAGRYFTAPVAKALATKDLTFDPLYNGQDARITALKVQPHPTLRSTRGVARVLMTFRNFGKPDRLTFTLFRTKANAWRINDIAHRDWRLRELLGMR